MLSPTPGLMTHMAAQSTKVIHSRAAVLRNVVLNTGAASAVLTIYNNSAGSGDVVAIIDCSNTAQGVDRGYFGFCPNGITAVLSGGDADVTIQTEGPGV